MATISEQDRRLHYRMINACIATLYIQDGGLAPDVPGREAAGLLPVSLPAIEEGQGKINAGFAGQTTDGFLIIALRGTLVPSSVAPVVSPEAACLDWTQDQKFAPVPWKVELAEPFGDVCEGFAAAADAVWPGIEGSIRWQSPNGRTPRLMITGHSKGGAMALLLAPRIRDRFPSAPSIDVVTFAAPCVGDALFSENYGRLGLTARTVRYQNQYDIVPLAPARLPTIPTSFLPDCTAIHQPVDEQREYAQIGALHYVSHDAGAYGIETDPSLAQSGYSQSVQGDVPALLAMAAHQPQGNYLKCFYGQ